MRAYIFNIPYIYVVALLGAAFSSCSKTGQPSPCRDYEDLHYYISEEERGFIPYTGHDTLTFLHKDLIKNKTDTITFVGQGLNEFIEFATYGYGEHHCDGRILKHSLYIDYISLDSSRQYRWEVVPESQLFSSYYIKFPKPALSGRLGVLSSPTWVKTLQVDNLTFDSTAKTGNVIGIKRYATYNTKRYGIVRIELSDSTETYQLLP